MKLTHKVIIELATAHQQLDGSKEGNYKFSAKIRYALAKNLRLLKGRSEDINKVRTGIIRGISPVEAIKDNSPELREFESQYSTFLDTEEDIPNLMQFTLSELNLDSNPIPVSVLSYLSPLIIEE